MANSTNALVTEEESNRKDSLAVLQAADNSVLKVEFIAMRSAFEDSPRCLALCGIVTSDRLEVGDELLIRTTAGDYRARLDQIARGRSQSNCAVRGEAVSLSFGTSIPKIEFAGTSVHQLPPGYEAPLLPPPGPTPSQRARQQYMVAVIITLGLAILALTLHFAT